MAEKLSNGELQELAKSKKSSRLVHAWEQMQSTSKGGGASLKKVQKVRKLQEEKHNDMF